MLKGLGYVLIVLGLVWFLYVLGGDLLAFRTDAVAMGQAISHILLVGLLPLLILIAAGGALVVFERSRRQENLQLEREQFVLMMLGKEGRLRFDKILEEMPLNKEQLRELLIHMGKKKLFTGIINWRDRVLIPSDEIDGELSHGECPICNSLTSAEDAQTAVCTRCEAYIFLSKGPPEKASIF